MGQAHVVRSTLIFAGMILMAGCASQELRQGTNQVAVFTQQVSEDGAEFARSRTSLARARRANIAMLEGNAIELETAVNRDLDIWRLAGATGARRVQLLEGIRTYAQNAAQRNTELSELRKRHEISIAQAKTAVDIRQAELAKVSSALSQLAQERDSKAQINFLVGYFKEVKSAIDKAKEEANASLTSAETAAKSAVPVQ